MTLTSKRTRDALSKDKKSGDQKKTALQKYKPGVQPASGKALENYHRLTWKQVRFLEAYAKNLGDVEKAAKIAGVAVRTAKENWLKEPGIQEEIARIQEVWAISTLQGTADEALARHIQLMNEMEQHLLENRGDTATASKVMNPLAKMSDSYMKATGKFSDDNKAAGVTVNINITDSEVPKAVEIDGEVIDSE